MPFDQASRSGPVRRAAFSVARQGFGVATKNPLSKTGKAANSNLRRLKPKHKQRLGNSKLGLCPLSCDRVAKVDYNEAGEGKQRRAPDDLVRRV